MKESLPELLGYYKFIANHLFTCRHKIKFVLNLRDYHMLQAVACVDIRVTQQLPLQNIHRTKFDCQKHTFLS